MDGTVDTITATATPSAPSTIGDAAASLAAVDQTATESTPVITSGDPAATVPEVTATPDADPSVTTEIPTDAKPAGPVPLSVHQKALENARTKAAQETEARLRTEMGWAQDIPAADGPRMAQMYQQFVADPAGYAMNLLQQLGNNPQYAPQIRSHAARVLGARQQQAAEPVAEPEPTDDVEDPNTGLTFMSGAQRAKWAAWFQRQLKADVQKELQPLKQRDQAIQQEAQQRQMMDQTRSFLDRMRESDPFFKEHEPKVKAAMLEGKGNISFEAAYNRVLREVVIPSLQANAESNVVASLQQKAVASSRNPAAAASATPQNMVGDAVAALRYADQQLGVTR
jgi:hypothetical protein